MSVFWVVLSKEVIKSGVYTGNPTGLRCGLSSPPLPLAIQCHSEAEAHTLFRVMHPVVKALSSTPSATELLGAFGAAENVRDFFSASIHSRPNEQFYVVIIGSPPGIHRTYESAVRSQRGFRHFLWMSVPTFWEALANLISKGNEALLPRPKLTFENDVTGSSTSNVGLSATNPMPCDNEALSPFPELPFEDHVPRSDSTSNVGLTATNSESMSRDNEAHSPSPELTFKDDVPGPSTSNMGLSATNSMPRDHEARSPSPELTFEVYVPGPSPKSSMRCDWYSDEEITAEDWPPTPPAVPADKHAASSSTASKGPEIRQPQDVPIPQMQSGAPAPFVYVNVRNLRGVIEGRCFCIPVDLGEERERILGPRGSQYLRSHGYTLEAIDAIIRTKDTAFSDAQFALALSALGMAFEEAKYLYNLMEQA